MNRFIRALLGLAFCLGSVWGYADCQKTFVFMRHGEENRPYPYGEINCQGENRALALPAVLAAKYGTPIAIYASNPAVTVAENCPYAIDGCCSYNRPIATINATAISLSMPVVTTYGIGNLGGPSTTELPVVRCNGVAPPTPMISFPLPPTQQFSCGYGSSNGDVDLAKELLRTNTYCGQTVFICSEHRNIPLITYSLFYLLGLNPANKIPYWPYGPCLYPYCNAADCSSEYNFDTLYVVRVNQGGAQSTISITLDNEGLNGQLTTCPT